MAQIIEHDGIVESVEAGIVRVKILQVSACSMCQVKSSCMASDQKERIIDVYEEKNTYQIGDRVKLYGNKSWGGIAVLWAFLLPFVLTLVTLLICGSLLLPEWMSGLFSLLVLVPYYFGIYLFRERLRTKFSFAIKRI